MSTISISKARPAIAVAEAAKLLQVSRNVVVEANNSGLIDLSDTSTILRAACLPIVTDYPGAIALRLGNQGTATDLMFPDGTLDTRPYTGWDTTMTPDEVESSSNRWWATSFRDQIVKQGFILLVRSSFIVGFLELDQSSPIRGYNGETSILRIAYNARLVSWLNSDGTVTTIPDARHFDDASNVVGKRLLGGGGGVMTYATA